MARKPGLDAAYALESEADNLTLYGDWARTYDADFADAMDYVLPMHVARAYVAAGGQGPVLDLGAGTGLCGMALKSIGAGSVDATDLSQDMLDVAAGKRVYARLFTGNLLERLPVDDDAYAGAVSSGTFTHGHVGPEALPEVLRVVRPGGVVALSINAEHWTARGFAAAFAALGAKIADLATQDVPIYGERAEGDHAGDVSRVTTFRKV